MVEDATAAVPGHVTLAFSVHRDGDPVRAGSRGVGIAIDEPVRVTVGSGTGQSLNGEAVAIEAVERVLGALDVDGAVRVATALPLGTGFGVSGAAALGTALAANRAFGCGRTDEDLVRTAHVAEVEAGTGLGDVVAQARGGVVLRLEAGAPPHGRLDGIPEVAPLEFRTLGTLSTPDVLEGDTAAITRAGEAALEAVAAEPTLERAFAAGRTFARTTGLLDPEVEAVIEAVEATGGSAAMAMLGRTVVAIDAGLSAAGHEAVPTAVSRRGARLVEDGGAFDG